MAEEREQRQAEEAQAAAPEKAASECDPSYSGACLTPNVFDYDCEGEAAASRTVTVVGVDHYGLNADGDGIGCEAE